MYEVCIVDAIKYCVKETEIKVKVNLEQNMNLRYFYTVSSRS